jgi:hypothetical protein
MPMATAQTVAIGKSFQDFKVIVILKNRRPGKAFSFRVFSKLSTFNTSAKSKEITGKKLFGLP